MGVVYNTYDACISLGGEGGGVGKGGPLDAVDE
jgi:hypothetical protein